VFRVADIPRHRHNPVGAELFCQRMQAFPAARRQGHVGARTHQSARRGSTNACARTGDHSDRPSIDRLGMDDINYLQAWNWR
jgi:hypothetical protein